MSAALAEFWVCVKGELAESDVAALDASGIATDDLRRMSAGFGTPIEWRTLRTCVRVSASDESDAKDEVAQLLSRDAGDLNAYSAEIFR